MGSLSADISKYIEYLSNLTQTNQITYDQIILLGSERALHPDLEDLTLGKTESAMMLNLYMQSSLSGWSYVLINAPLNMHTKRPTTDDTVYCWLETKPQHGNCLMISEQPFIQRQTKVLETLLPKTFSVTGSGLESDSKTSMTVYLDELSRIIYQEVKFLETWKE